LQRHTHLPNIHSFPTRRSSDLTVEVVERIGVDHRGHRAAGQDIGNKLLAHVYTTEPRTDHDRVGPLEHLGDRGLKWADAVVIGRSEEHTSELQSLAYLVCRLLL